MNRGPRDIRAKGKQTCLADYTTWCQAVRGWDERNGGAVTRDLSVGKECDCLRRGDGTRLWNFWSCMLCDVLRMCARLCESPASFGHACSVCRRSKCFLRPFSLLRSTLRCKRDAERTWSGRIGRERTDILRSVVESVGWDAWTDVSGSFSRSVIRPQAQGRSFKLIDF